MALRHDHTGLEWALNPMTSVLIEVFGDRDRGAVQREQGHAKTGAEAGMIQPQTKEASSLQKLQEVRNGPSLESCSADTLISAQ